MGLKVTGDLEEILHKLDENGEISVHSVVQESSRNLIIASTNRPTPDQEEMLRVLRELTPGIEPDGTKPPSDLDSQMGYSIDKFYTPGKWAYGDVELYLYPTENIALAATRSSNIRLRTEDVRSMMG